MPLRGGGAGPLMAKAILNFHFDYLTTSLIQIPGLFTLFLRPDFISFATFKGYQVGRNLHVKSGMIGKWYCVDNIYGVIEAKVTVGVMRVAAHMK